MAIDPRDPRIQAYLRENANDDSSSTPSKPSQPQPQPSQTKAQPPEPSPERKQRRLFKRKRAGIVLTREEVKAIKKGRKKLRKEMRQKGIKGKRDFELTASTLGLYFDKRTTLIPWLLRHWLAALLAALALLLIILFLFSMITQLRGHFTVSLSNGMFKEGFTLSETEDFDNPTTQLFALPAEAVPCISINQLPKTLDSIDGPHNETYFAYTYYIRNDGESTIGYQWNLDLNSESKGVSDAVWAAVFEDGNLRIYAKANPDTGKAEALPALNDNSRGYSVLPIRELAPDSDQFQVVRTKNRVTYWRVVPQPFETESRIASGEQTEVHTDEIHKYTVVLWIEGDDAQAVDDIIGGHLGVEMAFNMVTEADTEGNSLRLRWKDFWKRIWNGLAFWED